VNIKRLTQNKAYNKELFKEVLKHKKQVSTILAFEATMVSITVGIAVLSRHILDNVIASNMREFTIYLALYVFAQITTIILAAYITHYKTLCQVKALNSLQHKFLRNTFYMSWEEISKYHSGDILTRLTVDISKIISFTLISIPAVISNILQLFLAFKVVMEYDVSLGIYGFLIAPVVAIVGFYFGRKIKPLQDEINKTESDYRSFLNESVQNNTIIKTFENEEENLKKMTTIQKFKLGLLLKKNKTIIGANLITQAVYTAVSLIAFGWGAYKISLGVITFGMFTTIMQLLTRMQVPVEGIIRVLPKYVSTLSAFERCHEFFSNEYSIKNKKSLTQQKVGVQLENITFHYEPSKPIIDNFNLTISPGEKIAIMGESGTGKTTLLKILMGLLKPINGEIKSIHQTKLNDNHSSYYTYVPQGNTLFSGSIRYNMYVGDADATDEEIYSVLKIACAETFINELNNGLDTELGEHGLGLSEGQLQRLCIARALLRKAPVLLLDEATSALDKKTEENVIEGIYKNFPSKTVIAITHRTSILDYVDKVINIDRIK